MTDTSETSHCGCHLNHSSQEEHDAFWNAYYERRQRKIEAKAKQQEALKHPKTKAAKRRLKIHKVLRQSVRFTGHEPKR